MHKIADYFSIRMKSRIQGVDSIGIIIYNDIEIKTESGSRDENNFLCNAFPAEIYQSLGAYEQLEKRDLIRTFLRNSGNSSRSRADRQYIFRQIIQRGPYRRRSSLP